MIPPSSELDFGAGRPGSDKSSKIIKQKLISSVKSFQRKKDDSADRTFVRLISTGGLAPTNHLGILNRN